MDADSPLGLVAGLVLIVANMFFVAAEYALVGCRRSRIESLAKKGNALAKRVAEALDRLPTYVAGIQVAITLCGIGVGALAEPYVTYVLSNLLGTVVNPNVSFVIALLIVTVVMVVVGELLPKYLTLRHVDRIALGIILPLTGFVALFRPIIWFTQTLGALVVRPFGVVVGENVADGISREELMLLVKSGGTEGIFDKVHAEMVSRALKLDRLMARDIMIHRMDVQWLDVDTPRSELIAKLAKIPHSRFPVCRGDIDDLVGTAYLHDIVKSLPDENFKLETIVRPPVQVPETLTLDKIVMRMRDERTQMLIVSDEYGGTSGLITLEDVVEEIFGELEDTLESERPTIEILGERRISARAEVRFDELVEKVGFDLDEEPSTDTLATMIIAGLGRVPKIGDSVPCPVGTLRVENMARSRVTRVSLHLTEDFAVKRSGSDA